MWGGREKIALEGGGATARAFKVAEKHGMKRAGRRPFQERLLQEFLKAHKRKVVAWNVKSISFARLEKMRKKEIRKVSQVQS